MTFNDLKLIQPLLTALDKVGYSKPTPIQEQSIPPLLEGRDIFGCAQTGTGKTASFALPILQQMTVKRESNPKHRLIKTLILAPTRELALQIADNFKEYSAGLELKHAVIFGGVSQVNQVNELRRGIDILIATPGRLLDLMQQGHIKLNDIKYFVLDEADRMLDMGFIHDIKKVIAKLPAHRQTMFFSATAAPEIMKLANTLLIDPVKVAVTPVSTTAELVQQKVYFTSKNNKKHLLKYVLETEKIDHVLVFTRTKHGADKVAKDLTKAGIKTEAIHGNKSQGARERALNGFKDRTVKVLVATDIASRGIDVDKLSHVINFDIPEVAETYVHRIGRTGRAGSTGEAISFCMEDELPYWKGILKLTRQDIEVVKNHPYTENISADMPTVSVSKPQRSNGNGNGSSKKSQNKNNRWRGNRSFGGKKEGQRKA
jgi:ATP-dependent RNA helicase RhlE